MRKKRQVIFSFVVKYLYFLKNIPFAAWFFDALLKVHTQITNPQILQAIDEIEETVSAWNGVNVKLHKYGGVQFNYNGKELGHIHSNGVADIIVNQNIKKCWINKGWAEEHPVFKKGGWVSFYIEKYDDKAPVIHLLEIVYQLRNPAK